MMVETAVISELEANNGRFIREVCYGFYKQFGDAN